MTTPPDDALEQLLRSGLRRHADHAPDHPDLKGVAARAARRRHRRYMQGAGLASTALVVAAALVFVAGSSPRTPPIREAITPAANSPRVGPVTGSLVLPLTGTVQAGDLALDAGGDGTGSSKGIAPESNSSGGSGAVGFGEPAGSNASGDQSVDVPPGTGQTLDRLSTHVSLDGVIVSTFYAANTGASRSPRTLPSVVSPPVAVPGSSTGSGNSGSGNSASGAAGSGRGFRLVGIDGRQHHHTGFSAPRCEVTFAFTFPGAPRRLVHADRGAHARDVRHPGSGYIHRAVLRRVHRSPRRRRDRRVRCH